MNTDDANLTLLQYEEPDMDSFEVTEAHFREAIAYLVAIQPPENPMRGMDKYREALAPYNFYIRLANRTLRRYATTLSWAGPGLMQKCFYQYAADPSFFRKDLPSSTVSSILRTAWSDVWQD